MNNFIKTLICVVLLGVIATGGWFIYDKVVKPNINNTDKDNTKQEETTEEDTKVDTDSIKQIAIDIANNK